MANEEALVGEEPLAEDLLAQPDPLTRLAVALEKVAASQMELNKNMKESVEDRLSDQTRQIEAARTSTKRWRVFSSIIVFFAIVSNTVFGVANIKLNTDQTTIGNNVQDVLDYVNDLPSPEQQQQDLQDLVALLISGVTTGVSETQKSLACDFLDNSVFDNSQHWDALAGFNGLCVNGPVSG